jgi:hypothetical protein
MNKMHSTDRAIFLDKQRKKGTFFLGLKKNKDNNENLDK